MKLGAIRAGDVVEIPGPGGPRLAEVRAKQRGRLTVAPWRSAQTRESAAASVGAREVLAHYPRRARPSTARAGDVVVVDIRGRRFHARVLGRAERGGLRLQPITPHINYFHARARDLRARWAAKEPTMSQSAAQPRGHDQTGATTERPRPSDLGSIAGQPDAARRT